MVATLSIGTSSLIGSCAESVTPDGGGMDGGEVTDSGGATDATFFFDGPVANLIAPPEDSGVDAGGMDAGEATDAGDSDAGDIPDSGVVFFPFDGPVANLVAPPPDAESF